MFCGAFCDCCPPSSSRPSEPPRELREPAGSVALTVRLLSGEPLAELSAAEHMRADELRAKVEARAGARLGAEGCCVRALLWHSVELEGARTLRELGVRGRQDVVAVLGRTIEGEFEKFRPGCPTCDAFTAVARLCFELSGVASLSAVYPSGKSGTRAFRYTLGGVEEWDGPGGLRRSLCLEEQVPADGELCGQVAGVFAGWLELDAADPIKRRLRVEGLNVDPQDPRWDRPFGNGTELELEDVRALQRRGADEAQMRVWMLYRRYTEEEERAEQRREEAEESRTWYPTDVAGETSMFRRVFCRPRCPSERMLRDRCPKFLKPRHGRRSHCFWGQPCKGRGCHWICRHRGDVRAEAARARAAARRAERAAKAEMVAF